MSLFFISIFIIFFITIISMGIGLSISEKLSFRYKSVAKLFLSPIIGLSILLLYSIPVGYFATNKSIFFIIFSLIALYLLFENLKKHPKNYKSLVTIISFMFFGSFLSTLFTVIYFGEFNPFNDTYTYIVHSQWLQSNPFIDKAIKSGFFPALSQVTLYQETGERVGASFLMAIIQSGLSIKWSYYLYPALLSIAVGYSALVSGALLTFISYPNRKKILFACLIIFIMPSGLLYGAFTGFYPMTFGLLFVLGFITFIGMSVDYIKRKEKNSYLLAILSSLMFSAFLFSYSNYAPFLFLALTISFFVILLADKKFIKQFFILMVLVLLITSLIVNVELIRMCLNLLTTITIGSGGIEIGWPIYWSPIEFLGFMAGLKSGFIGSIPINYLNYVYLFLIPVIVSFFLIYGLNNTRNRRLYIYIILPLTLIFSSLIIFVKLRYFTTGILPMEQGATFLQLKTAKYASPFLIILLFSGFITASKKIPIIKKYSFYFLIIYFVSCISHNYIAMKNINGDFVHKIGSKKAFNELLNLKTFIDNNIPFDNIIYLDLPGSLHKVRQIVAYVLIDRKVSGNYNDDGYIRGRVPELERNMPIEESEYIIRHINNDFSTPESDIVATFGNLILIKNNPSHLQFKERKGGYDTEYDKDGAWNWTSEEIEYIFSVEKSTKLNISFYYHSMIDNSKITLKIYDGQKKIDQYLLDEPYGNYRTNAFPISSNSNLRVVFVSNKFGNQFNTDPRYLNFLIKNLRINYDE